MIIHRSKVVHQESGMILILVLILTGTLAVLALGSFASVESKVEVQRLETDGLRAEMAAQSGLELAKRSLINNPNWLGTDGLVDLGNSSFSVCTSRCGDHISVYSFGYSDDGKRYLFMQYDIESGGGGLSDVGLIFLTSDVEVLDSQISSDVFIADEPGSVYDYALDEFGNQTWTLNTDDLGETEISKTKMWGDNSYQYTSKKWFRKTYNKQILSEPTYMPAWNLGEYLTDGNVIVLNGVDEIKEQEFDETVVVIVGYEDTFKVTECVLNGGLIIYTDPDYDVRSGSRNWVSVDKSTIGSLNPPYIGLIAPSSTMKGNGDQNEFLGFNFWNGLDGMDKTDVTGMLIIVNMVDDWTYGSFNDHQATMDNIPNGIDLGSTTANLVMNYGGELTW